MSKLSDAVGSFGTSNFTPKEYAKEVKVLSGTSNVIRFIDGGESFLTYEISWIPYEDETDGKIGPFIVRNGIEGSSILGEMLGQGKYFKGGYLESVKGNIGKVFIHQSKDPELFKAMTEYWNPAYQGTGSCKPREEFMFNVISRNPDIIDGVPINWCAKEKHTKILRLGKPALASLSIVENNDGSVSEYDINYSKQGTGKNTVHQMMKAGVNVTYVVPGLLTEEEMKYTRYPLADIVKLSSAFAILKHIPTKIKRMDSVMGTNFYARFEKQAEIENIEWEKVKAQSPANAVMQNPFDDSAVPPAGSDMVAPSIVAPTSAPATVVTPATPVSGPVPSRRVKASADASTTVVATTECFACKKQIPQGSIICPECKTTLLEPCPECQNLFGVNEKECPVCHTVFE